MALSKIPDLTHSYKGQDYTFVDQLEGYLKELECPICRSIVSKPLLTSCGHLFCKECHNKLERPVGYQRVRRKTQCPVCQQEHTTMEDKFTDRRVNNLKVKCTNHKAGCEWVGSIGDEGQHRAKQDGCGYEEIPCTHGCGVAIRRMTQQGHSGECPMRPHNCEYCGDEGPYQCIIGDHLETCLKYPVQCPNGCQEKIPRENALSNIELKEELSAMAKKLQVEEQHAQRLKSDIKTKMARIDDLERHTTAKAKQIRQLERDAKEELSAMTQKLQVEKQRAQQLERDAKEELSAMAKKLQVEERRAQQLERDVKAKTEKISQMERITLPEARHTTTQLKATNETLTIHISEIENKQYILYTSIPLIVIICAILPNNLYFIIFLLLLSIVYITWIGRGT